MPVQGKLLTFGDDISRALEIRKEVFHEEMGLPLEFIYDDMDDLSIHVIIFENDNQSKAIATGRIYYDGEVCSLSQIAVLKDYRRKKYGDFTVRMLLSRAFSSGITEVVIDSFEDTVEFFKSIGFQETEQKYAKDKPGYIEMKISNFDVVKQCKGTHIKNF